MPIHRRLHDRIPPLYPGEFLREDFMKPLCFSPTALAKKLHFPPRRVSDIVKERRGLSAEMVLRLARYFRMSPQFWMQMQATYDLEVAQNSLGDAVRREVRSAPRHTKDRRTGSRGQRRTGRRPA